MDVHFEGAEQRSSVAFQFSSPLGWEIYGPATDEAVAVIRGAAEAADGDLTLAAEHLTGFLRVVSR
jgi:hypothetical protein